ncbi:MAG: S-methyl-5-thioribose-1-phosphate isomerase [Syntrophomonadaceae bacterium]|nr:S-methyl-5-thioribose-1-phosphate isomerase [Syntrophomonadaceae bacterium]MDD3889646.1 S-methyl-5-thioribose-1-phosphate isomerase [Syntrophomonadaceae bacterium]MDD4548159.1 S-methyl-5-thioribose-1-phosphate isomerase [Syntrophomonadaceae bacterium]
MKTVYFDNNAVVILDQSQLPEKVVYERCETPEKVADAIRLLKVRGAPLIGVTAAFGLAMAVNTYQGAANQLERYFKDTSKLLASTRPTAVNLFWALERMERVFNQFFKINPDNIGVLLVQEAEKMYQEDNKINEAIGEQGQKLIKSGSQIMTICNAGALATCGYGTALGVIRSAAKKNYVHRVWACETRPVLQGARLTVWELMQDKIPVTLITDNMAGYVMGMGKINAVIAGADRIAANGDTANKIGTYSLAVLARYHNIPFYIAAPLSTIDRSLALGEEIPIEERDQDEVRQFRGNYLTVADADVFNPAFDVTPNELISGIITEKGVIEKPFAEGIKLIFTERNRQDEISS